MPFENEKNILHDSDIIILKLMNMYNDDCPIVERKTLVAANTRIKIDI